MRSSLTWLSVAPYLLTMRRPSGGPSATKMRRENGAFIPKVLARSLTHVQTAFPPAFGSQLHSKVMLWSMFG